MKQSGRGERVDRNMFARLPCHSLSSETCSERTSPMERVFIRSSRPGLFIYKIIAKITSGP